MSTEANYHDPSLLSASWMIEGDYFEGCNCDVICPCIFMADHQFTSSDNTNNDYRY
jgi:hypothetical protein